MARVNDVLADFARGYQAYHNLTPRRRERQQHELSLLAARLDGRSLLEATGDDLRAHLEDEIDAGKAATTVAYKRKLIRPFFSWAYEKGLLTAEQFLSIRSVAAPRNSENHEPRPYNKRERERFWQDFERTYPWNRDVAWVTRPLQRGQNTRERGQFFFDRWLIGRSQWARCSYFAKRLQAEAIVSLAIYGGLRKTEIFLLDLDDMDDDNEYVIVHSAAKGTGQPRDRAVPWTSRDMRDAVEAWLEARRRIVERLGMTHERPWLCLRGGKYLGQPLTHDTFSQTVSRCGPWEFHRLRHTAATEMLRAGMPLMTVRTVLGHARVSTTEGYTRLLREDLVHQARLSQARFENQMGRAE